ncbi:hypothetical protein [Bacillus sp. NEAU-Y102]
MLGIKYVKWGSGYKVLQYGEPIAEVVKVTGGWCCYRNEEEYESGEGCYATLRKEAVKEFLRVKKYGRYKASVRVSF